MAPGVSGALITTVTALCVAIPAMFGYNFLVTSIRGMIVEMDNFAAELASEFEHKYVDHGARIGFPAMKHDLVRATRRLEHPTLNAKMNDECAVTPTQHVYRRSRRSTSLRCSISPSSC